MLLSTVRGCPEWGCLGECPSTLVILKNGIFFTKAVFCFCVFMVLRWHFHKKFSCDTCELCSFLVAHTSLTGVITWIRLLRPGSFCGPTWSELANLFMFMDFPESLMPFKACCLYHVIYHKSGWWTKSAHKRDEKQNYMLEI